MAPMEPTQMLFGLIERLDQKLDNLQVALTEVKADVAGLKATARFWGIIAGGAAGLVGTLLASFVGTFTNK